METHTCCFSPPLSSKENGYTLFVLNHLWIVFAPPEIYLPQNSSKVVAYILNSNFPYVATHSYHVGVIGLCQMAQQTYHIIPERYFSPFGNNDERLCIFHLPL
jgi:hypothetical protein